MKQSDDFKVLEKLWYQKLKQEGFNDIEVESHGERFLKPTIKFLRLRRRFNVIVYESTIQYYTQARKLLNTYRFKKPIHKRIWELHCEGWTERRIAKEIKIFKKSNIHYWIVQISKTFIKE